MANRSVKAISRGGAALYTSASAPHGAGETARSGGDRIVAGPGTRHRRVLPDHRPFTASPPGPVSWALRVPDRRRTPARGRRLPVGRAEPAPARRSPHASAGRGRGLARADVARDELRPVVSPAGWARLGAALEAGTCRPAGQDRVDGQLDRGRRRRRRAPAQLVPYWLGADLDVRWAVIQARPAFFRLTKRIHNMLHGHRRRRGGARGAGAPRLRGLAGAERRMAGAPGSCGGHRGPPRPADRGPGSGAQGKGATVVFRSHVGADHPNALVQRGLGLPAAVRLLRGRDRLHAPLQRPAMAGAPPG